MLPLRYMFVLTAQLAGRKVLNVPFRTVLQYGSTELLLWKRQ